MLADANSALLPDVLLIGYSHGFFPMADADTAEINWYRPDPRAIIPLNAIKLSRSLKSVLKKRQFTITTDTCFREVIEACADREHSWISKDIIEAYVTLHTLGHAHSVETWYDGKLIGGLYGVHLGGAFFGESMFSTMSNASKVAFAFLTYTLQKNNFALLDTQYINPFTESLGAIEISDAEYTVLLQQAMTFDAPFP